MNYKNLLNKITHKDFNGGAFEYYGCDVNVTMGSNNMSVHIEKQRITIAEFVFIFEIPRHITFAKGTDKTLSKTIRTILNDLYDSDIKNSVE